MGKLHDSLRDWLVLLGQSNGFEAWTPDLDNNVEFSKIKNIKVDYRPDVVWQLSDYFETTIEIPRIKSEIDKQLRHLSAKNARCWL